MYVTHLLLPAEHAFLSEWMQQVVFLYAMSICIRTVLYGAHVCTKDASAGAGRP